MFTSCRICILIILLFIVYLVYFGNSCFILSQHLKSIFKTFQFEFKLYSIIVVAMPCDFVLHCPKRYTTAIFAQTPAHFPSYKKLYPIISLRRVFIIWQTNKFACTSYILMRAKLTIQKYRCQVRAVFCVAVKFEHTQRNTLFI